MSGDIAVILIVSALIFVAFSFFISLVIAEYRVRSKYKQKQSELIEGGFEMPEDIASALHQSWVDKRNIIGTSIDLEAIMKAVERRYKHIDDMTDEEVRQTFDDVQDLLRDTNYE